MSRYDGRTMVGRGEGGASCESGGGILRVFDGGGSECDGEGIAFFGEAV